MRAVPPPTFDDVPFIRGIIAARIEHTSGGSRSFSATRESLPSSLPVLRSRVRTALRSNARPIAADSS